MPPAVGDKAPEFVLYDSEKRPRSLSEFLEKNTVLVFYPGAFTSVCTRELCTFRDHLSRLNEFKSQVVAISVDPPFVTRAFAAAHGLHFPLLSDFDRAVSQQYGGVYLDFSGVKGYAAAKRAVFILDRSGIIRYAWVSENPGVEPNYDELVAFLATLR